MIHLNDADLESLARSQGILDDPAKLTELLVTLAPPGMRPDRARTISAEMIAQQAAKPGSKKRGEAK